MRKLNLYIILNSAFLILNSFSYTQNPKIDSLLFLLKTDKADTNKVIHLYKICGEYSNSSEYNKGLYYGKQALLLAQNLGFKKGAAKSYNNIGNIYADQSKYPEALKMYFSSLRLKEEINDKSGSAASYNNIGNIYLDLGNYPEALKNYTASLHVQEEIKNIEGTAVSFNNIGNIYQYQGNYPEALKNYFASLKILEETKNKSRSLICYNNIGSIYQFQKKYSEAEKMFLASLMISKETGDQNGMISSYHNLGVIYTYQRNYKEALKSFDIALKINKEYLQNTDIKSIAYSYQAIAIVYDDLGNYPEALKNHFAALKMEEKIEDKNAIAISFINIGSLYTRFAGKDSRLTAKNLKEAAHYLNKALKLSKETGIKEAIKESYAGLTVLDSTSGNYKAAFEHHKLYISYRDSLDNEETKNKSLQSVMQYEFDKKEIATKAAQEKLNAISREEKKKQQIIIFAVAGVLLLVIIFSLFLFNRFRITQRQKTLIEKQKALVDQAYESLHEKNQEVLDSINYASRIQRALLPSQKYIANNLNKLMKN